MERTEAILYRIRQASDRCKDEETQALLDELHDLIEGEMVEVEPANPPIDWGIPIDPVSGYVPL